MTDTTPTPALAAVRAGLLTLADADGNPIAAGLPVNLVVRQPNTEFQIVMRHAGGSRDIDRPDLYKPMMIQFVVYHTNQEVAINVLNGIVDRLLQFTPQGGQEFWWQLNGWIVREVHADIPRLIETVTQTDMPYQLWGWGCIVSLLIQRDAPDARAG
jgi:hypothetical protein